MPWFHVAVIVLLKPMLPKHRSHAMRGFRQIFLDTMSLSCPFGGSPSVHDLALDSQSEILYLLAGRVMGGISLNKPLYLVPLI
jgi:hypothetical protein